MAMETAAAILTKLAFEQNANLKSRLNVAPGKERELVAVMMPLFRQILSEMENDRQTHDKFPSAIPLPAPGRSDKAPQSKAGTHKEDIHAEGHGGEDEDIGGEG
jgi:hypothetical protein